ncbi:MAG: precorrin-6Y C5,15-methyltransferase (decarboxylating) subunit CbiT [Bacillota bacterium]
MNRKYLTGGIPDEEFIRLEGVPMTKNEIRVLSLAKLQLFSGAVVYDVGAGSGSVSIECKLQLPQGQVFAIEKNPQAVQVLRQNMAKFGTDLQVIVGSAPAALASLPGADRIFIGGSGGNLPEILEACDRKLKPGGRIVINSVTINTGPEAFYKLKQLGYSVEAVQVNIAVIQKKGSAELWSARNPVVIITGQK